MCSTTSDRCTISAVPLHLNRLPPADRSRRPHADFKDYEVGFVHMDVKHLPKLQDRDGVMRKRYLYVAIDRASRYVHLAVKDNETSASAVAFLEEALAALPFRVTHVLTDRGSCFTADGFEQACEQHGVMHRKTRPTRQKPTAWSSASTGGCSGRSWASRSTAIATWKSYSPASTS